MGYMGGRTNLQFRKLGKKATPIYDTIYVSAASGSDANTGLKPSLAKATIQAANDAVTASIKYIKIKGGTYAEWPVIDKNVEFKGSYDATFTTQDFVVTPTILAKAGAGTAGYALTFTSATNNSCFWDKIESDNLGVAGLPAQNINILGSPKIGMATARTLAANGDAGYSTIVNNSTATDTLIIDGLLIQNENAFPAGTFVGLYAAANAKTLCRNILIATLNTQNSDGTYYGMYSEGGGSFVVENATITGSGLRGNSRGIKALGSGASIKNTIINGFQTYGIETTETIIAENNDIYGAATAWTGSVAPTGAYITFNPALDSDDADIGRFTPPPQGLPAFSNYGGTYHNGYIYVYYASILYRSADGITFVQFGFGSNLRFATLISFGSELLILGGDNGAGTTYYNSVYSVNTTSGAITAKNNGAWDARASIGAFVLNNRLYVTGGNNATVSYGDLWIYDKLADGSGTDSWTDVTPATPYSGRTQFGVGVINVSGTERVFIFGGCVYGAWVALNSCISWAVGETSWTAEQNLPGARMTLINAPVLSNKIYCCGGASTNWTSYYKTVFTIDDSKTWATVTSNAEFGERIASINVSDGTNLYVVCGNLLAGNVSDTWKSTNAGANWTETYDGTIIAGTPVQVSKGGTDLSAEFTTDKDGNDRTSPWSMGCYNRP